MPQGRGDSRTHVVHGTQGMLRQEIMKLVKTWEYGKEERLGEFAKISMCEKLTQKPILKINFKIQLKANCGELAASVFYVASSRTTTAI